MDGYLEDEIVNFDVVNSILLQRSELKKRYKKAACSIQRFDSDIKQTIKSMKEKELTEMIVQSKDLRQKAVDAPFKDECVHFNYQLPSLK